MKAIMLIGMLPVALATHVGFAQPYLGPIPGGSAFGPGKTAGMAPIPGITTPGRTPNTTVDIPGLEPVPSSPATPNEEGTIRRGETDSGGMSLSPPTGRESGNNRDGAAPTN